MHGNCRCKGIVTGGFEELALALGGIGASFELPDEAVWDLARVVDLTHERIQVRLSEADVVEDLEGHPESGQSHPAVSHLLQRLGQSQPESGCGNRG